jgi:hypothetical protein
MHNILQGVSQLGQRLSGEEQQSIADWISDNARRYWLSEGGPLRPPEEGGAHLVVVRQHISIVKKKQTLTRFLMNPKSTVSFSHLD